jgi:hypothetical protein
LDVGQTATLNYIYTIPTGGPTPPPVATASTDPSYAVTVGEPTQADIATPWVSAVTITGVAVNNTAPGATGAVLTMTEQGNASPPAYVLVGPDPTDTGAFDFTSIQYGPVP